MLATHQVWQLKVCTKKKALVREWKPSFELPRPTTLRGDGFMLLLRHASSERPFLSISPWWALRVTCGLLLHFWLLLFKLSLFSCRGEGRENHLTFLGLFKKKGNEKEKKILSWKESFNVILILFFFFLITCRGRPRPLGWRGSSPSLSACCIQARWRGTTRVRPMGTNLPFCSLPKASLIAVGPTLPYRRSLPEGEGTGRFKERKKEEKKRKQGKTFLFFPPAASARQKTRGKERRGSMKENKK